MYITRDALNTNSFDAVLKTSAQLNAISSQLIALLNLLNKTCIAIFAVSSYAVLLIFVKSNSHIVCYQLLVTFDNRIFNANKSLLFWVRKHSIFINTDILCFRRESVLRSNFDWRERTGNELNNRFMIKHIIIKGFW